MSTAKPPPEPEVNEDGKLVLDPHLHSWNKPNPAKHYAIESPFDKFRAYAWKAATGPADWFYEKVVRPNKEKNPYPYYHKRYRRVPEVDECYEGDILCVFEANEQFKRDRHVDKQICRILRQRFRECMDWYGPNEDHKNCDHLQDIAKEAEGAWFCKYGDMGHSGTVLDAYMKMKHRLVWERRHGPVGAGIKDKYSLWDPHVYRFWRIETFKGKEDDES